MELLEADKEDLELTAQLPRIRQLESEESDALQVQNGAAVKSAHYPNCSAATRQPSLKKKIQQRLDALFDGITLNPALPASRCPAGAADEKYFTREAAPRVDGANSAGTRPQALGSPDGPKLRRLLSLLNTKASGKNFLGPVKNLRQVRSAVESQDRRDCGWRRKSPRTHQDAGSVSAGSRGHEGAPGILPTPQPKVGVQTNQTEGSRARELRDPNGPKISASRSLPCATYKVFHRRVNSKVKFAKDKWLKIIQDKKRNSLVVKTKGAITGSPTGAGACAAQSTSCAHSSM
eukprot:CAMPEP_0117684646 /NCGR_PEP_ID=MMETSP0804-20121206/21231_1 /TAXON_ID=1074897 /ORGANISM="Tetraselmis astigmatica, Strain CCMP880" /LENGTH=290 /DNA_ID=CAMNT_0005495693 /DNA_START=447 /DNA_END=1320 /DNA_ORIENTATION=+